MSLPPAPVEQTAGRRRRLLCTRPWALSVALLGAPLLAGCTAKLDMDIKATGTFDAVVEMRDTTGTVFEADPDCSSMSSPQALGLTQIGSAQVTASKLTGADGSGCLVRISEVPVADGPSSDGEGGSQPLVTRNGDKFTVKLPPLTSPEPTPTATPEAGGLAGPPLPTGPPAATAAPPSPTSLSGLVTAHLQITFPGAVVDGGGGQVDGRTVTWTDPDVISEGVQASGLAQENAGLGFWDRFKHWITAGAFLTVIVLAVGLVRRNQRGSRRKTAQE
ncbi:LppM family (lipo)protein [Actinomyces trachealis]|uniref:LppM family (lipo)protein n=1 Tax=Actinomyces trachealis TaxID=2763540 RepID=UPI001892AC61|nr:translation initiation factor 2 [Actinomyces trachealis]